MTAKRNFTLELPRTIAPTTHTHPCSLPKLLKLTPLVCTIHVTSQVNNLAQVNLSLHIKRLSLSSSLFLEVSSINDINPVLFIDFEPYYTCDYDKRDATYVWKCEQQVANIRFLFSLYSGKHNN